MKEGDIVYRAEDCNTGHYHVQITYREYRVIRLTKCGFWIAAHSSFWLAGDRERWVSNTSRKRFAFPTKEEALEGLMRRRQRQAAILGARLDGAERVIRHIESLQGDKKPQYDLKMRGLRRTLC